MTAKKLVVLIVASGILTLSSWGPAQTAQSPAGTVPADMTKVPAPSDGSVKEWNEDLDYLIKRLEIMHPNLYGNVAKETFYGYAETLRNKVSDSTTNEMIIGIHELMAHIKNLHTFCTPVSSSPGLAEIRKTYKYYPVRFYPFEDGLYIRSISKKYEGACGKKVIKIGSLTAEEAMRRLSRFVAADNEMTVLEYLPRFFMNDGPLLQYIGASNSSDDIHLLLADERGREYDYAIQTDVGMSAPVFMNAGSKNPLPLYLKQANNLYWYEYLPEQKAIYLQINAFVDKKNEPFDKFCQRLFDEFDERKVERLIVDIRQNTGGNHIELPLVKGILNRPGLDRPDRLFIIIGRATVSAAQHFVSEAVRYTNATLFGEPTCSKPNQYGAIRRFNLPHSKLQIGCAVDYYQDAQPFDFSVETEPHFFVRLASADFRENRDPVLERIFDYDSYRNMRPEFAAQMAEAYRSGGLEGLKNSYDRIRPDYRKYGFNMKNLLYDDLDGWMAINKKTDDDYGGYLMFVHNVLPRAIDVSYDLASWLERSGRVREAKMYYQKCLELNPEHSYARMKLGLLDLEEDVKKTAGGLPEKIKDIVEAEARYAYLSGTVLVAKADRVIYSGAFGYANRNFQVRNTMPTKFNIGSITKTFTALGILQLMEQGKIKAEDPLGKYLPDCPVPEKNDITIHHLLTHTSGLYDFANSAAIFETLYKRTIDEMMPYVYGGGLLFRPGTKVS